MAKPRIHANLICSTAANANTVRTWLQGRIIARTRFMDDVPAVVSGVNVMYQGRFQSQAGADAIYNEIIAEWTSGANSGRILAGSWVGKHTCTHDDATPARCAWQTEATK